MNFKGLHDTLEVVNGPEDGAAFSITRAPCDIGSDSACAVNLNLDRAVQPLHARLSVVADGYRIRRLQGETTRVNGRRTGRLFSRIVRHGGLVQVGDTLLCLQCAPDGLASRSHGMPTDSDAAWLLRGAFRKLFLVVRVLWRSLRALLSNALSWIITILVILALLSFFMPGLRFWLSQRIQYWWSWFLYMIQKMS